MSRQRHSLDISPPHHYPPHPAHQPVQGTDFDTGLTPPIPQYGFQRSSSVSSGMSATSSQREVAGLGYDRFDTSAPSPTQAYLDYEQHHQSSSSNIREDYSPNIDAFSPSNGETRQLATANYSYPSRMRGGSATPVENDEYMRAKEADPTGYDYSHGAGSGSLREKKSNKKKWWLIGVPVVLIIAAAIAVGVYFGTRKKGSSSGNGNGSSGSGSSGGGSTGGTSTGGNSGTTDLSQFGVKGSGSDGSMVTTDLGVNFTYTNPFGGSWAQDPINPYSVSGKAQSWSPAVNETWDWNNNLIRGVNLGGWLVTEPFIVPDLYERYQNTTPQAVDEYTLSQAMGSNLATEMEQHYKTFITEQDFATIASYGLNWVRIPIGFWAVETQADEPYLPKVSWTYFLKAISWARKYGIRILLDIHALPGSQNGWNHSGKSGSVNFMYGTMGIANAERALEQIRSMVQYISQDGIKQVVPMISLVNEVQASVVGQAAMASFYYQAYNQIRAITGYGEGNGPYIVIHEGFYGIAAWNTFMLNADRLILDQHPYLAFGDPSLDAWNERLPIMCGYAPGTNDTMNNYGIVTGGEWSNAINNCGKWLNGVGGGNSYNELPGSLGCQHYEDWQAWTPQMKSDIMNYNLAQMDALRNFFFWTWKINNSTEYGYPTSPMWHYKLGVEQGWITKDPRASRGFCAARGQAGAQFTAFPSSAIGAVSTSRPVSGASTLSQWPPAVVSPFINQTAQLALMPRLTRTGTPLTLATPAHHPSASIGNGWAFPQDTQGAYVSVAGCNYPPATALSLLPTSQCAGPVVSASPIAAAAAAAAASPSPSVQTSSTSTVPTVASTTARIAATTAAVTTTPLAAGVNPATPVTAATAR